MIRFLKTVVLLSMFEVIVCVQGQTTNCTCPTLQLAEEMRTGGGGLMFGLGLISGFIIMGLIWLLVNRSNMHMPSMPHMPSWRGGPGHGPGHYTPVPGESPAQDARMHAYAGQWYVSGAGLGGYPTTYAVVQQPT
jgi:uncharacterized membrane protein YciS (DUF1049 family)